MPLCGSPYIHVLLVSGFFKKVRASSLVHMGTDVWIGTWLAVPLAAGTVANGRSKRQSQRTCPQIATGGTVRLARHITFYIGETRSRIRHASPDSVVHVCTLSPCHRVSSGPDACSEQCWGSDKPDDEVSV